ncbi:MAG: glycosidase [Lachnospiraceae bacterium]|nr:glycosidase [Lachnospiraceae bacterium]
MSKVFDIRPMLNAYPDSMGGKLSDIAKVLEKEEVNGAFSSFYILPSVFCSDLDRGFSVISYDLNPELANRDDIEKIKSLGINLKLDFVLNHISVQSPEFKDILEHGEDSKYADFFINWNKFWEGHGTMTEEGYIQPDPEVIKDMFFRKPGLPLLLVELPGGRKVPYWNTFYQEVTENPDGTKKYLGQMDLNIKSPLVWEYYEEVLSKLASYGTKIVRLDAFGYAPKEVGKRNFMNEPDTWDFLKKIADMAEKHDLMVLPEVHDSYDKHSYEAICEKGYVTYDFFMPGLILDAIENEDATYLAAWASEIIRKGLKTVNMLGCHDGIPLLDLRGLLPEERIQGLIDTVVGRGGFVKDLHGNKNMYYQVNATYYSALGEDDKKMELARALQLFMPGKPQVWYLDLFEGKNDHEAVARAGAGGHKEINRTNLTWDMIESGLKKETVLKQLELLKYRNFHPAFAEDSAIAVASEGSKISITWQKGKFMASIEADLKTKEYSVFRTSMPSDEER